ncbi:hypothetical protein MNBD_GAMMA16-682 [hydrothermal vent metagenome]|uniref:Type IV pilus biogenesis protein PilE n=1 Tax=hydrothermal vent metagenome TaxID=652676 RepID=A0A3B0ZLY1_9ZZZZ
MINKGCTQNKQGGFSLSELMITVLLIGIISGIAYPSYIDQIMKSRRGDATAALLTTLVKQETYYSYHGVYTADMSELGFGADPASSEKGFYQIDGVVDGTAQNFTLTATRLGIQADDTVCGDLTLTSTGVKSATNNTETNPAQNCW